MPTFEIHADEFHLNGAEHRVLSGAIHYFRVPRQYWADRIHKARLMGLNTIETYVPWNLHEPHQGQWVSGDQLDLGAFLDAIAAEGMHAIVRPGPYICAEFDGGALPAWLFVEDPTGASVRSLDPRFMGPVDDYLRHVYQIVEPRQISHGGPVILVQIENEYGAYGNDHDYLRALTNLTRKCGITTPLTTVDQPNGTMLEDGTLDDLLTTGSFGSRALERLESLRKVQPGGPLMCSEFWDGWFDQVGDYHHTTDASQSAQELSDLLEAGASVNIYMFHGGTNLGLTNGANDKGMYRPITTSYDYDAPLDESGHPTDKFWAFREVLGRFTELPTEVPPSCPLAPSLHAEFSGALPYRALLANDHSWSKHDELPTMDAQGQFTGFMHASCDLDLDPASGPAALSVGEIRDRAIVWADGVRVGVLERMDADHSLTIPGSTRHLDILIEDMGRVNYGPKIGEHKGIIGPVLVNETPVRGWRVLSNVSDLARAAHPKTPSTHLVADTSTLFATFTMDHSVDLFLATKGWGHGLVWINGYLLGRFNDRSPQATMYVPAPFVRPGSNDLIAWMIDPTTKASIDFVEAPDLGPIDW